MKVEFIRHSDTSLGRAKIGMVLDLPSLEAKELIDKNQAKKVYSQPIEEFEILIEEEKDAG